MKNIVKISGVTFGAKVQNDAGFDIQLVNINITEPLSQFKINDDGEKEEKEYRQITMRMSDFSRVLVLDDELALLDEEPVEGENLSDQEVLTIKYSSYTKALKGAELTIEREEIKETVTKDKVDENGDAVLDEDGDPVQEPVKDEDGKIVKKLVGYGDTRYTSIKLTPAAKKWVEKKLGF